MKGLKIFLFLLIAAIAGVGVAMAVTNPGQTAYDEFATQRLTEYLNESVCAKAPNLLGNVLQEQCLTLLQDNQAKITELISTNTERENFYIFSIYKTDLSAKELIPPVLSSSVPAYHFETVGLFGKFQIYKVEKQ
jgi:hypothetical protein